MQLKESVAGPGRAGVGDQWDTVQDSRLTWPENTETVDTEALQPR